MKKIIAAILALCLILSLTACSVNVKSTSTVTTSTTDADGNTTTTTTTTTNENGKVSETTETVTTTAEEAAAPAEEPAPEFVTCAMLAEDGEVHSFPFRVVNATQYPVVGFYTTPAGGDVANSGNILGESVLEPGANVHGDFSYNKDNLVFDFIFYFNDTEFVRIPGIDFTGMRADIDIVALQFIETEQDTFKLVTE